MQKRRFTLADLRRGGVRFWEVSLRHDSGVQKIRMNGANAVSVINTVLDMEKAPVSAVVGVRELRRPIRI